MWGTKNIFQKLLHLAFLVGMSPIMCLLYVASPYRDHKVNIFSFFISFLQVDIFSFSTAYFLVIFFRDLIKKL